MQVLQMDKNPESHMKPVKAGQHYKAGSKAGEKPGKNKKFAEVYEHLLASAQTAVSESKIKQSGSHKRSEQAFTSAGDRLLLRNVSGQGSGPESGKRNLMGHQAKLTGMDLQAPGTAKTGKDFKQLKAAEQKGSVRAGTVFTHNAARSNADEPASLSGTPLKQLKTAEQKGSERAGRGFTHNAARSNADEPASLSGTTLKQLKTAEQKGSERAGRDFTHNAAEPATDEVRQTVIEFRQLKASEQKGSERAGRETAHNAAEPADEAVSRTVKDLRKLNASEAKVLSSEARPIITETRQTADHEFTFIRDAVKSDSQTEEAKPIKQEMKGGHGSEARDFPGEVNQLKPEVNNIQALGKTAADKAVMSKSQIDFIVYNLTGQIKNGTSSLEVDLKPEYLGKIKLLLEMNDGSVSIRIIAHNAETMALVNSSMPDIRESLEQQGIRLNNMSVDLGSQEKQEKQTGSGTRDESRSGNYFRESQESHDNTGSWEQNYFQSGILNILA